MFKLIVNESKKLYYVVNIENGKCILETENKVTAQNIIEKKQVEYLALCMV